MTLTPLCRATAAAAVYKGVLSWSPRLPRYNHCFVRSLAASRADFQKYYTKKHEWVELSDDKATGTVGITHYAQESLGDVVYVQLPDPDLKIEIGVECGALESVKAASELYSPVSGKVIEKNEKVEDLPALINTSPEDEGWLFKLKLTNAEEVNKLMSKEDYDDYLKSQEESH